MHPATKLVFLLLFASVTSRGVGTRWWNLAMQSVDTWRASAKTFMLGTHPMCSSLSGLSPSQARVCQLYPDHMATVGRGVQLAIAECQHQLQWRRWNCSTTNDSSVFGPVVDTGSREAAFVHAISAAGVVYAVSRACRDAQLSTCGCSRRPRPSTAARSGVINDPLSTSSAGDWQWGGCGDNTDYGYKFAQGFVDVREREKNYPRHSAGLAKMLMNVHNNEAGRLAVYNYARTACKCHGVSGSCNLRTCWHQLPAFRDVGDRLRSRYDMAVEASFNRPGTFLIRVPLTTNDAAADDQPPVVLATGKSSGPRRQLTTTTSKKRRRVRRRSPRPSKEELLYVDQSPDYCEPDEQTGTPGTHGRRCERGSGSGGGGPQSCDLLCCGRGYNAFRTTVTERCRCKFHWCCEVRCGTCERAVDMYVCK